jgi:hypothetical protein
MTPRNRDAMVATAITRFNSHLDTGLDLDKLDGLFETLILK